MNNKDKDKEVILLSDIDGVYADWLDGFIKYCESIGHIALHNKPTDFAMTDIFPELAKPWELIMDYQHSPFYQEIKSYDEVKQVYSELYDMGVKIVFVTSCGLTEEILDARRIMINRETEGKYHDIEFLELGASKADILKKYPTATFIDDQIVMAIEGAETGHKSFLRDMPYNSECNHKDVTRLTSFKPLIKYFAKKLSINNENTSEDSLACG